MRYLLMALGLWFCLEMVFVAILVVVSAIEGHQARRQGAVTAQRVLLRSDVPLDRRIRAQGHRAASA